MSSIIGTFSDRSGGDLTGMVRTLQFQGPIEWVPNGHKSGDNDPGLVGYAGDVQIGRAYEGATRYGEKRTYYRAILDDPSFVRQIAGNIVMHGEAGISCRSAR